MINTCQYDPLNAGSSYVSLPPEIAKNQGCVNVKNNDVYCFAWAIVSSLYPAEKNGDRISSYPHFQTVLDTENFEFPMDLTDIERFERVNDISVNVYKLNKKNELVGPIFYTKQKRDRHVNLLLIRNETNSHYVDIKDSSSLVYRFPSLGEFVSYLYIVISLG